MYIDTNENEENSQGLLYYRRDVIASLFCYASQKFQTKDSEIHDMEEKKKEKR
jgi:hypothetical protein